MIDRLASFAAELRAVGIPVSMVEVIDAAEALEHADLSSRDGLRAALASTMVKSSRHRDAFDRAFDVFFSLIGMDSDGDGRPDEGEESSTLRASVVDALDTADRDRLLALIRAAVEEQGRLDAAGSIGGSYYAYRVLRRLDPDEIRAMLVAAAAGRGDTLDQRIARDRAERLIAVLRGEVQREVLRRLIAERGTESVARSFREPLVEDLDLQHATRDEVDAIGQAVAPLAKKLATRLSQRRRHGRHGRLDVRRTIRRSLAYGGVLVEPRFRAPRVAKPQIVLLCDTSGSMATFSRFTMQLTHAIASELSGVRSFVFVEGIDEVTSLFSPDGDFDDSVRRIASEADVFRSDGHSDYGGAFTEFADRHLDAVTARTTVIIAGDGRTNYRPPAVDRFEQITMRARAVFWLNPEADRFWDTGDSEMSEYAPMCDQVAEVRTLRHLERFIERAALPAEMDRNADRMGRSTPLGQPPASTRR
ncbi:MAG: VWA domain-containing protein [Actinomycetota bacterium]